MASIDPNKLDFQWRNYAVGPSNLKDTFSVRFTADGQPYTFVPESVITKGINDGSSTIVFPYFLNQDNLNNFFSKATPIDLAGASWYGDWLKDKVGSSTSGYLVPGDVDLGNWKSFDTSYTGDITGIAKKDGNLVYATKPNGWDYGVIGPEGAQRFKTEQGSSLLGNWFGGVGVAFSNVFNSGLDLVNSLGPVGNLAISVANPVAGAAITGANLGNAAATGNLELQDVAKAAAMSYAANQIAGGLSSPSNTGAPTSTTVSNPDYTAGANYGYSGDTGGLGIQASQGTGTNLYQAGSGGGLGLNANVGSLFGSLINPFTGDVLGNQLANLNTGADTLGNVDQASSNQNKIQQSLHRTGIKAGLGSLFGGNTGTNNMATSSNANLGNLLGGLLGGAGGLMQGSTNTEAMKQYANDITQAGNKAQAQAAFRPVGMTTSFGTSNFQVDPTTGQITQAGYTLSPQLQAAQEGVLGGLRQNLTDAQTQAALGRSYLAQNPQEVASNWLSQQQALLAPSRDTAWARLNQGNYNQGTMGLKVAQGGNLQAANPYASALANAQAQQDLTLASQAQQQGQNAVTFGQGLLSSAYAPLQAGLNTASGLEQLGQMPFGLSTNLANLSSTAGARQASNYATAMGGGIQNQLAANSYSPWATALQGTASNPLASYGLMKLFA
jgi:hypothetical protein